MRSYRAEPDPFPASARVCGPFVVAAVRTDQGQERNENQDRAAIVDASTDQAWQAPAALRALVDPSGGFYAVVCDGMGGEAGGAIASSLALETIVGAMRARWLSRSAEPAGSVALDEARVAQAMTASLEAASARIKRAAREEPCYARMGTTATLATIVHGALVCAQIGDSRAYLLRGTRLLQVTEDQTMAELLRKSGNLAADQIASIVGPNVILQALGSSTNLDVAFTKTPLAKGDIVLVCSDGLYGVVSDAEIADVLLRGSADLGLACDVLISMANAAGGPDNISCAAFQVMGDSLPQPESLLGF
jgi:protein phosphatase